MGGMPGKVVVCATKGLERTYIVALRAMGREGTLTGEKRNMRENLCAWSGRDGRVWYRNRNRNSDRHTTIIR